MIGKKAQKLSDLQAETSSTQHELQSLRRQVLHQNQLMESMWTILKTKLDLSDDDLLKVVLEVEKREKKEDAIAKTCPNCSRHLQKHSKVCIYCGSESDHRHLF